MRASHPIFQVQEHRVLAGRRQQLSVNVAHQAAGVVPADYRSGRVQAHALHTLEHVLVILVSAHTVLGFSDGPDLGRSSNKEAPAATGLGIPCTQLSWRLCFWRSRLLGNRIVTAFSWDWTIRTVNSCPHPVVGADGRAGARTHGPTGGPGRPVSNPRPAPTASASPAGPTAAPAPSASVCRGSGPAQRNRATTRLAGQRHHDR